MQLKSIFYCLIAYFGSVVVAQPSDCSDRLLKSEIAVSAYAQSYLRLIDYLAQNTTSDLNLRVVFQKIAQSEFTTNAFDVNPDRGDSLMYQLMEGADKLLPNLTTADWERIKAGARDRAARWKVEQQDRHQKAEQTQAIFSPQVLMGHLKLPRGDGDVSNSPSWQKVGSRDLLAVSTHRGGIAVYERVGEKISLVVESGERIDVVSNVAWHIQGDRVFLSVIGYTGVRDFGIFWMELVGNKLISKRTLGIDGWSSHPPVCQNVNNNTFCVVITHKLMMHMFRLVDGRLVESGRRIADPPWPASGTTDQMLFPPQWIELNGQHYLFNRNPSFEPMFQLVNGRPIAVQFKAFEELGRPESDILQITTDDRSYFVYSAPGEKIHVLEFYENDFRLSSEIDVAGVYENWRALRRGDRVYLVATLGSHRVDIFEFSKGNIRELGTVTTQGDSPLAAWVPMENREILAVGDRSGTLRYFELYDEVVTEIYSSKLGLGISSIETWFNDNDEIYQIIGTSSARIHLIKVLHHDRLTSSQ